MGLKGAIERLLRRRNADTGQRIKASEERRRRRSRRRRWRTTTSRSMTTRTRRVNEDEN